MLSKNVRLNFLTNPRSKNNILSIIRKMVKQVDLWSDADINPGMGKSRRRVIAHHKI
jgi:hypothetical protein